MRGNWTEQELWSLALLFRQGLTDKEIGDQIGRSKNAVAARRIKMGLRRDGPYRWSERSTRTLRDQWEEGVSVKRIANRLRCAEHAVRARVAELELPARLTAFQRRIENGACPHCGVSAEFRSDCPVPRCANYSEPVTFERSLLGSSFDACISLSVSHNRGAA